MYRKIIIALAVTTLAVVILTNWQTSKLMDRVMEEPKGPALAGQSFTSHGVTTDRWVTDTEDSFLERHMVSALKALSTEDQIDTSADR